MPTALRYTRRVEKQLDELGLKDRGKHRKVMKALDQIKVDPSHPGLRSHEIESYKAPDNGNVFESYAENNAPGAWRVFWHYGPDKGVIAILAVVKHP
ncbi:MAG TPA: hypothetical protein VGN26_24190 [Armatimonadota bacterium]|jgi:hypothetical protein